MGNRFLKLFLAILFLISQSIFAQFYFKANLECGLYYDSLGNIANNLNTLYRAEGNLKYKYLEESTESSIFARAGSEFYNKDTRSLKFKLGGSYIYSQKNVAWKANINFNHFSYNYFSANSVYNNFVFVGGAEFNFNNYPLNFLVGFSNQNAKYQNSIDYNSTFFDISSVKNINNYFSIIYGVYIQNFSSESHIQIPNKRINSLGWNFGPELKINYLKNIVINFDYKFLIYSSNDTKYPSYEHQIEIIGGVILENKISLFFLADLLIRKLSFSQTITDQNIVLILPSKNENQIALKASYLINKNLNPYLKFGYFNEDLFIASNKLKGLNLLLGIEVKF
jgi:hypothetical protein